MIYDDFLYQHVYSRYAVLAAIVAFEAGCVNNL